MPSGIKGYNFYLDGVKINTTPVADGGFTFTGLTAGTDYSGRITSTAVDVAGNESDAFAITSAETTAYTPGDEPMSPADAAAIDALVAAAMAAGFHQTGVMVAVIGPRGYYTKAYGTAGTRPLTPDDHFRIGSITKTFTATAIFMQVDAGNLDLDDTVDQYVAGIPNGHVITIRNLLMMSSGLINDQTNLQLGIQLVLNPTGPWSPDSTLAYIRSSGFHFAPGTFYEYNSANYILLGYVLQAITGRAVRDIILQDIVAPLGLTETTWPADSNIQAPFSHGYGINHFTALPFPIISAILVALTGQITDQTAINPAFFDAAGAMTSTIGDLIKWGTELRDGTLLSPEMKTERQAIPTTGPMAGLLVEGSHPAAYFNYGMGIFQAGSWFGHDGSIPGFDDSVMFEPVTGSVIAVMENFQTDDLQANTRIHYDIARYLFPGSADAPDYLESSMAELEGIPSAEAFGAMQLVLAAAPGDADGTLTIPHKVPYVVWQKPTARLTSIHSAEDFGALTVTGGYRPPASTVTLAAVVTAEAFGTADVSVFNPADVTNLDLTDEPVPVGAAGCWVTEVGGGAAGAKGTPGTGAGGRGGGGGGGIDRVWIPRPLLGDTYSTTWGRGSTSAASNGTASSFVSGMVALTAGGGFGQNGGTCSASGLTATSHAGGNGGAGGNADLPAGPGNSSSGNAGAGGGGGGANITGSAGAGANGGNSVSETGGAGGATAGDAGAAPTDAADGAGGAGGGGAAAGADGAHPDGGAGGNGGLYGGGGGGGGAYGTPGDAGVGGDGYLHVEWQ